MQRTILLVDDDAAVRRMLSRLLSEENYRVISAPDRENAADLLKNEPIDLILLDLTETRNSDEQLFKKIRAEKSSTPVILIAAPNSGPRAPYDFPGGILLEKPLDLINLLKLIEELLQQPIEA